MDDATMRTIGRNICALAQEMRTLGENLQRRNQASNDQQANPATMDTSEPKDAILLNMNECNNDNHNNNKNNNNNNNNNVNSELMVCDPAPNLESVQDATMCLAGGEDVCIPERDREPFPKAEEKEAQPTPCPIILEPNDHMEISRTVTKTTKTTTKTTTFTTRSRASSDDGIADVDEECMIINDELGSNNDQDDTNDCDMGSGVSECDSRSALLQSDGSGGDVSLRATCEDKSYILHLDSEEDDTDVSDLEESSSQTEDDTPPQTVHIRLNMAFTRAGQSGASPRGCGETPSWSTNPPEMRQGPVPNPMRFHQVVDVSGYRPEDIEVIITDGVIAVRANHVEFDNWPETGTNMYSDGFCDCYSLPPGIDPESVKMNFTPQGMLVIDAPLPPPTN